MGLVGSLHCAGMCSPLACAVCGRSKSRATLLLLVRLLSYTLAGIIVGTYGQMIFRSASRVPGIAIIGIFGTLAALFLMTRLRRQSFLSKLSPLLTPLRESRWGAVLVGGLMPLLPCGFLWMALAQSALISHPIGSAISMGSFALGTAPALFLGQQFWAKISSRLASWNPLTIPILSGALCLLLWGWTWRALSTGAMPCH